MAVSGKLDSVRAALGWCQVGTSASVIALPGALVAKNALTNVGSCTQAILKCYQMSSDENETASTCLWLHIFPLAAGQMGFMVANCTRCPRSTAFMPNINDTVTTTIGGEKGTLSTGSKAYAGAQLLENAEDSQLGNPACPKHAGRLSRRFRTAPRRPLLRRLLRVSSHCVTTPGQTPTSCTLAAQVVLGNTSTVGFDRLLGWNTAGSVRSAGMRTPNDVFSGACGS